MGNPTQRVGFVGIGTMGVPMARQIAAAGFDLTVHDAVAANAASFAEETGCAAAGTARAVAAASDVVITMLPTSADVRAVALDADGLAEGFSEGDVLIDMGSSEPSGTAQLAAELGDRGIAMIDAPVSGGRAKAIDGSLTLMVGGDNAVIDRCADVLAAMGEKVFRTGAAGSGHAVKAINNLLNAVGLLAGGEALLIGKRFGLDPNVVVDVVDASTGMNHAIRHKFRQRVFSRSFDAGFGLDLMVKDLDTAMGMARETRTPAPFSAQCREMWAAAQLNLGPGAEHTELVRWLEMISGAELHGDG